MSPAVSPRVLRRATVDPHPIAREPEAPLAGGLGVYTRRSGFATRDLGRNRRDIGHKNHRREHPGR